MLVNICYVILFLSTIISLVGITFYKKYNCEIIYISDIIIDDLYYILYTHNKCNMIQYFNNINKYNIYDIGNNICYDNIINAVISDIGIYNNTCDVKLYKIPSVLYIIIICICVCLFTIIISKNIYKKIRKKNEYFILNNSIN